MCFRLIWKLLVLIIWSNYWSRWFGLTHFLHSKVLTTLIFFISFPHIFQFYHWVRWIFGWWHTRALKLSGGVSIGVFKWVAVSVDALECWICALEFVYFSLHIHICLEHSGQTFHSLLLGLDTVFIDGWSCRILERILWILSGHNIILRHRQFIEKLCLVFWRNRKLQNRFSLLAWSDVWAGTRE